MTQGNGNPASVVRPLAMFGAFVAAALGVAWLVPMVMRGRPAMANAEASAEQAPLKPAAIDGDRAYGYLKRICEIGPRPAGSAANTKQRELVAEHFKKHGGTVREQAFAGRHPLNGRKVAMANLIGSWFPDRTERVVLAAHYDTRPFPDEEDNPRLRQTPFIGANDGASGVALLMELAHHLSTMETPYGVDLVLLDGEELVYSRRGEYFLGSKAFGQSYRNSRRGAKGNPSRYVAGFVLDMVGGKELDLPREPYSVRLAPDLVDQVWGVAAALGASAFREDLGREVLDDHLAMNDAGIPTIDIIDFNYPVWHKAADRPDQCSGASLAQVGRVLTAWLSRPKSAGRPRNRI